MPRELRLRVEDLCSAGSIVINLAPGWLYALSQCGLFVGLLIVLIVGMGMSA
ncbi:hypothetical protein ACLB1E_05155 [Escherichia coli]